MHLCTPKLGKQNNCFILNPRHIYLSYMHLSRLFPRRKEMVNNTGLNGFELYNNPANHFTLKLIEETVPKLINQRETVEILIV